MARSGSGNAPPCLNAAAKSSTSGMPSSMPGDLPASATVKDPSGPTVGCTALQDLRAGHVQPVIARLKTLRPPTPELRENLEALIRYYTDNASRMRYDEYLRLG